MNKGKILYLNELFNQLAGVLRELSSDELNLRGILRRYSLLERLLRQISTTADTLADGIAAEIREGEKTLCARKG